MIALITGATAGIGKATAIEFAKHGYDLIICGRRKDRLSNLSEEISSNHNVKIHILSFDIRNENEVVNAINSLNEEWKNIDVLVNNAGLAVGMGAINEGIFDDWNRMVDTNIKGLLYMTKTIANLMVAKKSGHIINIASIAGKEVYPNGNVYCASKHAVDALSRAMRTDLLQHHIKVTNIAPGMVETEFSLVRYKGDEERAKKVYQGLQPLKAEDIAETIYWCANRPAHVNINDIVIMPSVQANSRDSIRN